MHPVLGHRVGQLLDPEGGVGEGVHALLVKAARPLARKDLRRVAVRLGASLVEAEEALDDLVGDALLIAG